MPRRGVVPENQSSDTAVKIGNAVLTHLNLPPDDVDRFYSKPIDDKLLLVMKSGTQDKRWMLIDADSALKVRVAANGTGGSAEGSAVSQRSNGPQRFVIQALLRGPSNMAMVLIFRHLPTFHFWPTAMCDRSNTWKESVLAARALIGITGEAGCGKVP